MLIDAVPSPMYEVADDGGLQLNFHAGQWRAWDSQARFVVVLAGTQGGKTSFGPWWLHREIQRRGPGDYMVVTPTFPLLEKKALPEFLNLFEKLLQLGSYVGGSKKTFTFTRDGRIRTFGSDPGGDVKIFFGHAQDPESLESATARAAWLDEAGQNKFKLSSYEAIMRRLSLAQGRVLITTTPYNLGWLKQKLFDQAPHDPAIEVVRFESTENPGFPQEEMERARRDLPLWKFNMFYRAIFTRPAGMIYDCFDEDVHKVPAFDVPGHWPRYVGVDFGGVNTAAVFLAEEGHMEPQPGNARPRFVSAGRYYVYREYLAGGRLAEEHARYITEGEPRSPMAYGGASSEGQWRSEFTAGGLLINQPPVRDVEVGINRVYGMFKNRELFVMDNCEGLLDEILSYSRELDEMNEPTEQIADKNTFHRLDALRYIGSYLREKGSTELPEQPQQKSKWKNSNQSSRGAGRWRV